MNRASRQLRGFTLIELMMVIVIVGVLMAIVLPAYQNQVIKTKRSVAKGELLKVAARQEQFFVNNKRYATDLADLGYDDGADGYEVDAEGRVVADDSGDSIYLVTLSAASATGFTVQAEPRLGQAKDKQCKTFTLTSTGVKGVTGAPAPSLPATECW